MAYFKNVSSFEDLKSQFRELARANHPDAGGDPEVMKLINQEYDQLFPIWKHRYNQTASEPTTETADSTRAHFYTQNGWAGSKYDINRTTKEVAAIVRAYVKETYPTFKFSVRYSHASMCSEVHTELVEAPEEIYKTFDQLTEDEVIHAWGLAERNWWINNRGCLDDETMQELRKAYEEHNFLKVYTEYADAVLKDVEAQVNSYRYDDSDGMIDYFDCNFYYFGCKPSDKFKVVPKTARIKNTKNEVKAQSETSQEVQEIPENIEAEEYDIQKTEHTKTHETIWTVKVIRKLDREEYIRMAEFMKSIGGYYSRFVHAFVFKEDPTERLVAA